MTTMVPAPIASLPWKQIGLTSALATFGAVILYSAAGGSMMPWAGPHLVRFTVLLIGAVIMSYLPLDFWKFVTIPAYLGTLALLVVVELMGFVGGGSQRWIDLGFINLQPSEIMKPVIVLSLALFYDRLPSTRVGDWDAMLAPLVIMAMPSALVLLQPDLGTTLAILFGGIVVMFLAGTPMIYYIVAAAGGVVLVPLAYFFAMSPYQQRRVSTFLDPSNDPLGAGYHISQSKIAIGSGGLFGKGFLNGTQSHLDYLPEGHTDFVFATMAEEWGMMGALAVLAGYFFLMRWGLRVALRSNSRFGKLAAAGLTCTIFFYAAVNMLMVVGLAPVVGIPLPFLSHGGSSMMTIMLCVGILMSIDRYPGRKAGLSSL